MYKSLNQMMPRRKSRIKAFLKSEARAYEFCSYATTKEIDTAYSRASMHGDNAACEVFINELDKRNKP